MVKMRWFIPWTTPPYGLSGTAQADSRWPLRFVVDKVIVEQSVLTIILLAHAIIPLVFHIHLQLHFAVIRWKTRSNPQLMLFYKMGRMYSLSATTTTKPFNQRCIERMSTRSPFVTLLSRGAQSGRWSSFGKRVWFTESHIVLIISSFICSFTYSVYSWYKIMERYIQ